MTSTHSLVGIHASCTSLRLWFSSVPLCAQVRWLTLPLLQLYEHMFRTRHHTVSESLALFYGWDLQDSSTHSTQKSPRMVPMAESDGLVAPSILRPSSTTFTPVHTMHTTGPDACNHATAVAAVVHLKQVRSNT